MQVSQFEKKATAVSPSILRTGPIPNRKQTDIFCCAVYILFFLLQFGITVYAWYKGDPEKLLQPYDADRNKIKFHFSRQSLRC